MTAQYAAIKLSFNPYETSLSEAEITYRAALADGLEAVLDAGASTLEEVASGLNGRNVSDQAGHKWTPETLEAELSRLAW